MDFKESSSDDTLEVASETEQVVEENNPQDNHQIILDAEKTEDNFKENSVDVPELSENLDTKLKMKEKSKDKKSSKQKQAPPAPQPALEVDEVLDEKLPQSFSAKYLGKRDAAGLWGIKYTRKPVDEMVAAARNKSPIETLPFLRLVISIDGVNIGPMPQNDNNDFIKGLVPIHTISYGVQDLVYTRVFAIIIVSETNNVREKHPFQCHAFVCDSRQTARRLTYSLAQAFTQFSKTVKADEVKKTQKKFAIDLRSPDELKKEAKEDVVDDSEA